MTKLTRNESIYILRYLATVSLYGILIDRMFAKWALKRGKIEKITKQTED